MGNVNAVLAQMRTFTDVGFMWIILKEVVCEPAEMFPEN